MGVQELAARIDAELTERALVVGTPPPAGRDLDLLVSDAARAALLASLEGDGFKRRGDQLVRFGGCGVEAVELAPAAAWGLPDAELEDLFAEAEPLDGHVRLSRPSPAHALLVEARRFAAGRGGLGEKARRRIGAALERDPDAWAKAEPRAFGWRLDGALAGLRGFYETGTPLESGRSIPAPARIVGRARRSAVVAFSGLDGAGKSSQSEALAATLSILDVESETVWSPLGQSPILDLVGKPAKRLLSLLRFGRFRDLAERSAGGSVMTASQGAPAGSAGYGRQAWATFVALVNAFEQRGAALRGLARGEVVILDRQALDAVVRMRFLYGDSSWLPLQRRLIRLVAPTPRFAYYLEIRPQTSLARKSDRWDEQALTRHAELYREEAERLGVRRLDGERPRDELCEEIAREVWGGLRA